MHRRRGSGRASPLSRAAADGRARSRGGADRGRRRRACLRREGRKHTSGMDDAAAFPEWIEPMAATLTQERFTSPEWTFERKVDDIRLLAFRRGTDVRL